MGRAPLDQRSILIRERCSNPRPGTLSAVDKLLSLTDSLILLSYWNSWSLDRTIALVRLTPLSERTIIESVESYIRQHSAYFLRLFEWTVVDSNTESFFALQNIIFIYLYRLLNIHSFTWLWSSKFWRHSIKALVFWLYPYL